MIPRTLSSSLARAATQFRVLLITGPRQSGKTTVVRHCFPQYSYTNLEDLNQRQFAESDPLSFLATLGSYAIIDEVQQVPSLLSYIQVLVDEHQLPGEYILTGSQNMSLAQSTAQSLAGRVAVFTLLPLSNRELKNHGTLPAHYEQVLLQGGYPEVHTRPIDRELYYASYLQTYIERDVRQLLNIRNVRQFQLFVRLLAGRIGSLLNLSSLANDVGIDQKTAREWISILEASYVVLLLQPYHRNFGKRLIKSPKIYFTDTGLAAYLLGIHSSEQLATHYLRGELFENLVLLECYKHYYHHARSPQLYFWRDSKGTEIDLLLEHPTHLQAVEIKSSRSVHPSFFDALHYFHSLAQTEGPPPALIYGGDSPQHRPDVQVFPWHSFEVLLDGLV